MESSEPRLVTRPCPASEWFRTWGVLSAIAPPFGDRYRVAFLAPLSVGIYLASFVLPIGSGISVAALALSGCGLALFGSGEQSHKNAPLRLPVLLFLAAAGIAILTSEDPTRSLRLNAPLLPAMVLFVLIAHYFSRNRHTRLLYVVFSSIGLGLAMGVLWTAWNKEWVVPPGWRGWMSDVRSPILVVPNDIAFLGVIAPFSVALFFCGKSRADRVLASASLLLGVCAICVMQSRVAVLTMAGSLISAFLLLRRQLALPLGLGAMTVAMLMDAFLGWPLAGKFAQIFNGEAGPFWDARIPIWSTAWANFQSAPWLGHGSRTFNYTSIHVINTRWAHNLFLETLAEQGVLGISALGFLLNSGFSSARKLQRASSAETKVLGSGAFAALIGFCVAGFLELSFLREWVVVVLFVLMGVISQLTVSNEGGG